MPRHRRVFYLVRNKALIETWNMSIQTHAYRVPRVTVYSSILETFFSCHKPAEIKKISSTPKTPETASIRPRDSFSASVTEPQSHCHRINVHVLLRRLKPAGRRDVSDLDLCAPKQRGFVTQISEASSTMQAKL